MSRLLTKEMKYKNVELTDKERTITSMQEELSSHKERINDLSSITHSVYWCDGRINL